MSSVVEVRRPPKPCTQCTEKLGEDDDDLCYRCRMDGYPHTQLDTFLRRAGFVIAHRFRSGALWILDGHLFNQQSALNIAQRRLQMVFHPRLHL